jgi:hypothetical protein
MGIFHEMPSDSAALDCVDCHEATNRLDFVVLGYSPRSTREGSPLCMSCHEQEEQKGFYDLHKIHVESEDINCGECHTFTR